MRAIAWLPNISRRQPCSAGTSAPSSDGDAFEVLDGRDHLGGNAVALGRHAQQHLEQFDRGIAVGALARAFQLRQAGGVAGNARA